MLRYKLILGSQSPRRKELLGALKIPFQIKVSPGEEPGIECAEKPEDYVLRVAQHKANFLLNDLSQGELLLTSDTIVVLDSKVLGKPKSKDEAKSMLSSMSARSHDVLSSLFMRDKKKVLIKKFLRTRVTFKKLSALDIESYLSLGTYADKAGSYGIQDEASKFVESIEGSLNNVIGLPVGLLVSELERVFGCDWRKVFIDTTDEFR